MEPSFLPAELPTFASIDTQSAVQAIQNVYQALKRALTDAQLARSMDIEYIRNQGNKFSSTIDLTMRSSQDGIILAMDALTFLSALENSYDDKALTGYLEGLDKIAKFGLDRARQCNQQFLDNIGLISQVGWKPTKHPVYSTGGEPQAKESRGLEKLSSGHILSCLSLPFTLPSLIKRGTKQMRRAKSEGEWPATAASNELAVNELTRRNDVGAKPTNVAPIYAHEQLEVELDNLQAYLSHLVAWWSETETKLCQMRDILKCHDISLYREALVHGLVFQKIWTSIKHHHSTYRDQVSMIQDYYHQFNSLGEADARRNANKINSW